MFSTCSDLVVNLTAGELDMYLTTYPQGPRISLSIGGVAMKKYYVRNALVVVAAISVLAVGVARADAAPSKNFAGGKTYNNCSGFKFIGTHRVGSTATLEVFWNGSSKQNCVILRRDKADMSKHAGLVLQVSGDGKHWVSDVGQYKYYAGAVHVKAPKCLWIRAGVGQAYYTNKPGSHRFGC
jgi:hypothetical protein